MASATRALKVIPLAHILSRKLEGLAPLDDEDRRSIEALCNETRRVNAGEELIRQGERPNRVFLLLKGWAYRYKLLPDGGRQVLAYLIPGDLCDIHIFVLGEMDHGISLLSAGEVATIAPDKMIEIMDRRPRIQRALWWATLVDEAILREWLVNVGRRDVQSSLAHLLCEMWSRMQAVGLADGDQPFSLPLTQTQLADTLGVTPVAINRALRNLREDGLITLEHRTLTLHSPEKLAVICGFEPNYLHLDQELASRLNGAKS